MTYVPIQTRIRQALLTLFAENLNDALALCGHEPLPASAFQPVTPGDIMADTVAVAYLGAVRAARHDSDLRLTVRTRDNLMGYVVEIWSTGPDSDLAQTRAEAVEFGVIKLLDDETLTERYLGGLLDQPIVVGDTSALSAEDENRASMLWHLALPLSCRVRTTRPEQSS